MPGPGWHESTEGDLDPDLAEEFGWRPEDADRPRAVPRVVRPLALLGIALLIGAAVLRACVAASA